MVDAVGGATFATAIEHVAPRGVVVNLATGSPDEVVSFHGARFDRAAGATIRTFNLRDELDLPKTSCDLARLAGLPGLISSVELEAPWQEVRGAIDALLRREIVGKAVLHVRQTDTFRE